MNRLVEIPKLFGLTLNEVFHIQENPNIEFKFSNEGFLFSRPSDDTGWHRCSSRVTEDLLVGLRHIVNAPWQPEFGETYYIPDFYWARATYKAMHWLDNNEDDAYYEAGLVCRTSEIAINKAKIMLAVAKE